MGIVDFRHLEYYAYLRQKLEHNKQLSQLYLAADSIGLRARLDYYHYQIRRYLLSDNSHSTDGFQLKFKATYLTHVHKFPIIVPGVFVLVQIGQYSRHLFSLNSLKRQFGPAPLQKAVWPRLAHIIKKSLGLVRAGIDRAH